ncbi:hypothetical protein R3P38DRAFT_3028903 [Favolaschia claudopus]|uniref:Oxidase ustYa n=1 Tax=Favolaschia claudopus TaxID=2862362 RepID=A0AAW0AEC7_9AGAR
MKAEDYKRTKASQCFKDIRYWALYFAMAIIVASAYAISALVTYSSSTNYQLKPTIPGTSPVWDVGFIPNIYLNVENTVHYQLNSSAAQGEWAALVPPNGGIVYVGRNREPFLPSVFHQLRCLDILRQAYVLDAHNTLPKHARLAAQSRHCLNYLRQMIMCRANLRLEPVVDPFGVHAVNPWGKLTCSDWRVVYKAFSKNEVDYTEWLESHSP